MGWADVQPRSRGSVMGAQVLPPLATTIERRCRRFSGKVFRLHQQSSHADLKSIELPRSARSPSRGSTKNQSLKLTKSEQHELRRNKSLKLRKNKLLKLTENKSPKFEVAGHPPKRTIRKLVTLKFINLLFFTVKETFTSRAARSSDRYILVRTTKPHRCWCLILSLFKSFFLFSSRVIE